MRVQATGRWCGPRLTRGRWADNGEDRMRFVKPAGPRATTAEGPSGLEISIPARRNPFAIAFLPIWLVGWAFGEIAVIRSLLFPGSGNEAPILFLLFWLTGWTLGGLLAIVIVLWSLSGRECLILMPDALIIRYEVLQLGHSRAFDLTQVRHLRVSPVAFNPFDFKSGLRFWGIGGGLIAFDYGSSTVHAGGGVDESEANEIVAALKRRHTFRVA